VSLFGPMGTDWSRVAADAREARKPPGTRWCVPNGDRWCEDLSQSDRTADFVSYALSDGVWTACLERVDYRGNASMRVPTCEECAAMRKSPVPAVRIWITSMALTEGVFVVLLPEKVLDLATLSGGWLRVPGPFVGHFSRFHDGSFGIPMADWHRSESEARERVRLLVRRQLDKARREVARAEAAAADFKAHGMSLAKTKDEMAEARRAARAARRAP